MDHYKKSYLIILFPLFISGCGNYSSNEDTVDGKIKPFVISISPSEGETNVVVTTSISLQFSKGIKTNTVTTNSSNTNCSGTVQISSDNFSISWISDSEILSFLEIFNIIASILRFRRRFISALTVLRL